MAMPEWVCPFCSERISSLDSEEMSELINRHLQSHQPLHKKIMSWLFSRKRKEEDVEKMI